MATWKIDTNHSSLSFKVKHLGVAWVRGSASGMEGTINFDEDSKDESSFNVTVPVSQVSTGNEHRDGHLMSAEFLDAENHPEIKFESSNVSGGKVLGNLSLHGETKEVELEVEFMGVVDRPEQDGTVNKVAIFEGKTTIDRYDFGIDWNMDLPGSKFLVGKEIMMEFSIEAVME